jgi:hypothetical protein
VLRDYTAAFDTRILGLTGSPELMRRAADSFRVQYEIVREPGAAPDNYTMNHTAGMVLLDGPGRFLARFAYGMPAREIVRSHSRRVGCRRPLTPAMATRRDFLVGGLALAAGFGLGQTLAGSAQRVRHRRRRLGRPHGRPPPAPGWRRNSRSR